MKGLLKGFRYITQIFEGDEKEQDMEIGFPTDVKHVAHIGWDGPSTTAPSWMNEFRSAPLGATAGNGATDLDPPENFSSCEFQPTGDTPSGEPPRPRPARRKDSSSAGIDSPGRDPTKQSRRRPSTGAVPIDSPVRESSDGSRRSRRNRSGGDGCATETDSPQPDLPAVPKQPRRRRPKESSPSSSGGSSRSARNKASESDGSAAEAPPTIPEEGVVV